MRTGTGNTGEALDMRNKKTENPDHDDTGGVGFDRERGDRQRLMRSFRMNLSSRPRTWMDMKVFDIVERPDDKKVSEGRCVQRRKVLTVRATYLANEVARTKDVDNEFFACISHISSFRCQLAAGSAEPQQTSSRWVVTLDTSCA